MLNQGRRIMTVLTTVFAVSSVVIFAAAVLSPGMLTPAPNMVGIGATGALLVAATAWLARWYMKKALFWLAYDEALTVVPPQQRGAQTGDGCRPRR